MRFQAHRVDTGIRAAPAREVFQCLLNIHIFEVECVRGTGFLTSHLQPVRVAVDGDHTRGAQQVGAGDCQLPHRSASPNGDDIAGFDVAHLSAHVCRWKNIGEEKHLVIGQALRHFQRSYIGEGNPDVLRLPTGETAEQVRVAK